MAGVVRITVPRLPGNEALLADLLARCADYPDLVIDWRVDEARLNAVENCIDMGVRLGLEPQPLMIVRRIAQTRDLFVAARRCKRGGWWSCFPACAARAGACFSIARSAA